MKYNTKYNIDHSAIDSELCEILKTKIKKYIEMTDYPMHPTYPRYLSKVGLHNQQKALPRRVTIASVDSRVSQQSRNVETHTPKSQNPETTTTRNQNE